MADVAQSSDYPATFSIQPLLTPLAPNEFERADSFGKKSQFIKPVAALALDEHNLDEKQAEVLRRAGSGQSFLFVGPPSSGRSSLLALMVAGYAKKRAENPAAVLKLQEKNLALGLGILPEVVVLTTGRARVKSLRAKLAARLGAVPAWVQVCTPAAIAQKILELEAAYLSQTTGKVVSGAQMLSGAQQDEILRDILRDNWDDLSKIIAQIKNSAASALILSEQNIENTYYRTALRDFLARGAELGLSAAELYELGKSQNEPMWVVCAYVWEKYLQVLRDIPTRSLDFATMLSSAVDTLEKYPDIFPLQMVLVDDYQDFTLGAARLLTALRYRHQLGDKKPQMDQSGEILPSAQLIISGNPYLATETFRGGATQLLASVRDAFKVQEFCGQNLENSLLIYAKWKQELHLEQADDEAEMNSARAATTTAVPADRLSLLETQETEKRQLSLWPRLQKKQRLLPHIGPLSLAKDITYLENIYESTRELADFYLSLCADLPVLGLRREKMQKIAVKNVADDSVGSGVKSLVFPSRYSLPRFLASELQQAHFTGGVAWNQMAVVVRSQQEAESLRSQLAALSIPVAARKTPRLLRSLPAPRALFWGGQILEKCRRYEADAANDPQTELPDIQDLAELFFTSPLGGLDCLEWNRLVISRSDISELIAAYVVKEKKPEKLEKTEKMLLPGLEILRAGFLAWQQSMSPEYPDGLAERVFWAMWDKSALAGKWAASALAGKSYSAPAEQNLDDLLTLFNAAQVATERGRGGFKQFLNSQLQMDLPSDSIARQRQNDQSVQVLTPASAQGGKWDLVVIAGLEYDKWPKLALRSTVFNANKLGALALGIPAADQSDWKSAYREVLADEMRLFTAAMARARQNLLLLAVADDSSAPSLLITNYTQAEYVPAYKGNKPASWAQMLAALRIKAQNPAGSQSLKNGENVESAASAEEPAKGTENLGNKANAANRDSEDSAKILACLAAENVEAAKPENWWTNVDFTAAQPLDGADTPAISCSKLGQLLSCPLRYGIEKTQPFTENLAQKTGTMVHAIFEKFGRRLELSAADYQELKADFAALKEQLLPEVEGQIAKRKYADRLDNMCDMLVRYLQDFATKRAARKNQAKADNTVVLTEIALSTPVKAGSSGEQLKLVGRLDRIEIIENSATVVDLKTGKTAISQKAAPTNEQLLAYQALIASGALAKTSGAALENAAGQSLDKEQLRQIRNAQASGAVLFYPAIGTDSVIRQQEAQIEVSETQTEMFTRARNFLQAYPLLALAGDCRSCNFRLVCPHEVKGARLGQRKQDGE